MGTAATEQPLPDLGREENVEDCISPTLSSCSNGLTQIQEEHKQMSQSSLHVKCQQEQ